MNKNYLERQHLDLLREVQRQGTLTAAAQSLGLSQSALSHAIRKLEDACGTAILERDGRRLKRTAAGDYLLGLAERISPQFEQAETTLAQFAQGERGSLRIGMECHPCYRWLLSVVAPYLKQFPKVDLDVKQKFRFGGLAALFAHEIDLLVTPDPLTRPGVIYHPVFDYELQLVTSRCHRLAKKRRVMPEDLESETLFTYPVEVQRLDIFTQFLLPAGVTPRHHKTLEATDIMLQMVASDRGVTALPGWLVRESKKLLPLHSLKLGPEGIRKSIHLGSRESDAENQPLQSFISLAQKTKRPAKRTRSD